MSRPAVSLQTLLQRSDLWRGDALAHTGQPGLASGFAALDAVLPGGGWPRGALTELLSSHTGIGALSLLLPALAALPADAGWIALVAPPGEPAATAWQAGGVRLSRLLVVRAQGQDAAWACEQLLTSDALAALVAWLPQPSPRALRRLQLAQQGRRATAFILRPARHAADTSPAVLRVGLAPAPAGLALRILKRRGPPLHHPLLLPVARPLPWARARRRNQPVPCVEAALAEGE